MDGVTTILDLARRYVAAGLSVIPVRADGSKAPALPKWEAYKDRQPTDAELVEWFGVHRAVGLAIVCGKVSGNLAVLDFESQSAWDRWLELLLATDRVDILDGCPLVKTPKGGMHVYCREMAEWVAGGKLAMVRKNETAIEIRGQGHYVLAPGCPPACHPLNRPYVLDTPGWLPNAIG